MINQAFKTTKVARKCKIGVNGLFFMLIMKKNNIYYEGEEHAITLRTRRGNKRSKKALSNRMIIFIIHVYKLSNFIEY